MARSRNAVCWALVGACSLTGCGSSSTAPGDSLDAGSDAGSEGSGSSAGPGTTVALFGGFDVDDKPLNDTWLWNGSVWKKADTAGAAPPGPTPYWFGLAAATMANSVVLFDGVSGSTDELTWTWSGSKWTRSSGPNFPSFTRVVGFGNLVAAAPLNGIVVFYDGQDTWQWNGSRWAMQTAVTGLTPPTRAAASMATFRADDGSDELVLFGGFSTTANLGDTWVGNGTTWKQVNPTPAPSARASASMASLDGAVVLFGGEGPGNPTNDTWIWNGRTWSQATPAAGSATPPARASAAMASVGGKILMFGGYAAGTYPICGPGTTTGCCTRGKSQCLINDTWLWDGRAWAQVDDKGAAPSLRGAAVMAAY
jgi:hypothetical protein